MLKHKVGEVLKQLMYEHSIDETSLSKVSGVSKSNISRMKNDPYSNPTYASLKPIADYFSISVSQLLGEESLSNQSIIEIPLLELTHVSAWLSKPSLEYFQEKLVSNLLLSRHAFAFNVTQKTLNTVFCHGSIVLCDRKRGFQDGDYVLVNTTEESLPVIKQLVKEGEQAYLKSLHPDLTQILPLDEGMRMLAYVVEVRYLK